MKALPAAFKIIDMVNIIMIGTCDWYVLACRNEFYQIFYGVFDDQFAAMNSILNGKESFALEVICVSTLCHFQAKCTQCFHSINLSFHPVERV